MIRLAVPVLIDEHAAPAPVVQAAVEGVKSVHRAHLIRSRGAPEQLFRDRLHVTQTVVHVEPC